MFDNMLYVKLSILSFICLNLYIVSTNLLRPVDLSWEFDSDTIYWIGQQKFEITKMVRVKDNESNWYATNEFRAGEHGGTHLDAPFHFYEDGMKVGDLPLENLIAHGVLVDISQEVLNSDPFINLEKRHLEEWQIKHGDFKNNTVVLIKTGWSKYYHDVKKYLGMSDDTGTPNFPGISSEAAQWLVDTNCVVGVGLDTPSVDEGNSTEFPTHRILNTDNMYLLENVKLIDDLPARGFILIVLPMKIAEGTGAPVRIVAMSPKHFDNF